MITGGEQTLFAVTDDGKVSLFVVFFFVIKYCRILNIGIEKHAPISEGALINEGHFLRVCNSGVT